jgi:sec-independent protein translocase protein TatC
MLRPPVDIPMGLGNHLDELRRRLIWPVITVAVLFVAGFAFQAELKTIMIWPLQRAIELVPESAKMVGLPVDGSPRILQTLSLQESASTAAQISFYLALAVAAPVVLWQLWKFVAVGLTRREQRLAFLFVPVGVATFYFGTLVGYRFGMPYFYAFLIDFTAGDPTATIQLRQSEYVETFFLWTVAFGCIMLIPWLIVVVVRTGMLTPKQISKGRKFAVLINAIAAAIITPGSDLASLLALFVPMQILFEGGLLISRFFVPKPELSNEIERE